MIKSAHNIALATCLLLVLVTATVLVLLKDQQFVATVNGRNIQLSLADSEDERRQGLSGRTALGADSGMLFVFEDNGRHCMWMKDMRFALDILWLNEQGVVISQERNITPDTYPKSYCNNMFDARYVLEVPAGSTKDLVGNRISLPAL